MKPGQIGVLSMWQPWASLLLHRRADGTRFKAVETRSRNTKYRGPLLIHAAKKVDEDVLLHCRPGTNLFPILEEFFQVEGWEAVLFEFMKMPRGAIIGQVEVIGSGPMEFHGIAGFRPIDIKTEVANQSINYAITNEEFKVGHYDLGRYGWLTRDPLRLSEPEPLRGQQGIFYLAAKEIYPKLKDRLEL